MNTTPVTETTAVRESGQTMAEYAVVLGVISAVIIATLGVLSTRIDTVLNQIAGAL